MSKHHHVKVKNQQQLLNYCKRENIAGNISPMAARSLRVVDGKWKTSNCCSNYEITRTQSGYVIQEIPRERKSIQWLKFI
jgi:hypothetical protein